MRSTPRIMRHFNFVRDIPRLNNEQRCGTNPEVASCRKNDCPRTILCLNRSVFCVRKSGGLECWVQAYARRTR
jgi:hypothetical protein